MCGTRASVLTEGRVALEPDLRAPLSAAVVASLVIALLRLASLPRGSAYALMFDPMRLNAIAAPIGTDR